MGMRGLDLLLPISFLVSICLVGCASNASDGAASGSGGTTSVAGSGGSTHGDGAAGTSTQSGTGGTAAGGSGAVGHGGSGGTSEEDASIDGEMPDVAGTQDSALDTGATSTDAALTGRYWLSPCEDGWTREQCCMHYCECMMTNCPAQLPNDCQNACVTATNWKLDCRVEQCFESLNPKFPQDAISHCKHAVEMPTKCQNLQP